MFEDNGNIDSGEQLVINRLMILEIGWILTNLAYLDESVCNILLQNDQMQNCSQDDGSLLNLTKHILSNNKNDLQIIDQYLFFLTNLG